MLAHTLSNFGGVSQFYGNSVGTLNALYPNSKVQTFDLHGFWFGCQTTGAGQANGSPAEQCNIQVTGYKQDPHNPAVCQIAGVRCPPSVSLFLLPRANGSTPNPRLGHDGSLSVINKVAQPVTFSFLPGITKLYKVPMVEAKFDSMFTGLTNVSITLTKTALPVVPATIVIDNVNYTTHSLCCN